MSLWNGCHFRMCTLLQKLWRSGVGLLSKLSQDERADSLSHGTHPRPHTQAAEKRYIKPVGCGMHKKPALQHLCENWRRKICSVVVLRSHTQWIATGENVICPLTDWCEILWILTNKVHYLQVTLLDDLSGWLDKLEREPGRYREFAKRNVFIKRIITEGHICIYFSPEASKRSGPYAESFMI